MGEKGILTAWASKQKLKKDIASSIKHYNDGRDQQASVTAEKPTSPRRRGLLKGLLASAAALAVSAIPSHGRITKVEHSMEQPDPVPDLASKKISLAEMETPDLKGPKNPEVRKHYLDLLRSVAKEQIKLSPQFQAQLDSVSDSDPNLRFMSSNQKNFNEVSLEFHNKGNTEESVLYTKIAFDEEGGIKSLTIRNGLIERIDKIKAEQGFPPTHIFGPDDMRSRAVEVAQKRLGKSQASDWVLQNNDSIKNNSAASRRDESWEINRVVEQPGYRVSQTVKVGQVIIEATKAPAVAQQK